MIEISASTRFNDGSCYDCGPNIKVERDSHTYKDYPIVLVIMYHSQFRFCHKHYNEMLEAWGSAHSDRTRFGLPCEYCGEEKEHKPGCQYS